MCSGTEDLKSNKKMKKTEKPPVEKVKKMTPSELFEAALKAHIGGKLGVYCVLLMFLVYIPFYCIYDYLKFTEKNIKENASVRK